MAAKRVSKSAINWTKALENVAAADKDALRVFKARQDAYVSRVNKYTEDKKPIDFAAYKARVDSPALIDALEKEYQTFQVAYPKDNQNLDTEIRKIKSQGVEYENFMRAALTRYITCTESFVKESQGLPALANLNKENYMIYNPGVMNEPHMMDCPSIVNNAGYRFMVLRKPPFWKLPYQLMVQDGVDWLFLRGDYKDEFKNANAHMDDVKETPKEIKAAA